MAAASGAASARSGGDQIVLAALGRRTQLLKTVFFNMEAEQIINEVHKNPVLYDTSHCDYKNNRKKDQVWDEIGRRYGISGKYLLILYFTYIKNYT